MNAIDMDRLRRRARESAPDDVLTRAVVECIEALDGIRARLAKGETAKERPEDADKSARAGKRGG